MSRDRGRTNRYAKLRGRDRNPAAETISQAIALPKSCYSRSNKRPIGTYEFDPRPHLSRSESYAGTI